MSENPELDKALAKQDLKMAINEFFQDKLGSEAAQAEIASRALAENFKLTGASLMFGDKLAREAIDEITTHLKRQNYAFLLPADAPDLTRAAVDPALLERGFINGSPDARAEIFRRVGKDTEKFDALARDFGLRDANDYRTKGVKPGATDDKQPPANAKSNPWAAENWSPLRQSQLVKQIGLTAATAIAESAGSFVGATSPNSKRMIPQRRTA